MRPGCARREYFASLGGGRGGSSGSEVGAAVAAVTIDIGSALARDAETTDEALAKALDEAGVGVWTSRLQANATVLIEAAANLSSHARRIPFGCGDAQARDVIPRYPVDCDQTIWQQPPVRLSSNPGPDDPDRG